MESNNCGLMWLFVMNHYLLTEFTVGWNDMFKLLMITWSELLTLEIRQLTHCLQ